MPLKIGTKIVLIFAIFLVEIISLICLYFYIANRYDYYTKELQLELRKLELAKNLERSLIPMILTIEDIPKRLDSFKSVSANIEERIENLYKLELNKIEERNLLSYVTEKYAHLKKLALKISDSTTTAEEDEKQLIANFEKAAFDTLTIAEKFHWFIYQEINKLQATQEKTKYLLYFIIFTGVLLNISLILGSLFFLRNIITLPLITLRNIALEIGKGNLDKKVKIESKDEIGELGSAFNKMVEDLKNTQTKLIQAEKLASLGKLAAGVAHEIKNPLSIIIQGIEFVKSSITDASLIDALERIKNASFHANKIVKDLLDFSHQIPPVFKSVDISSLIEETISLIQYQTDMEKIKIEKEFHPNLPKVSADPNQMKQVFINIIFNAIDAMFDGGKIKILACELEDYIQIKFIDSGCGIPKENLEKVFDPFFSTKKNKGSTGLGLTVTRSIIESHHGTIELESEVGKGTTVIIKLPIHKKEKKR